MSNTEEILERARNYLTSGWSAGTTASRMSSRTSPEVVYDHSLRVLEVAKLLVRDAAIPEPKLDYEVITVCCLFHDAGWVDLVKSGQIQPAEVYAKSADGALFQRSARIVCDQVGELLPARTLEKVVGALSEMKSPHPEFPETFLVADADNLEDFGLLGFMFQVRAAQSCGKSAGQLLAGWHRQQEYHYWEARINNALFLETSKTIARHRLETLGQTFDLLDREIHFENTDLKNLKAHARVAVG